MNETVSIVLINWNQLEVTAACLESLQRLTWRHTEVVVVDNGSTGNDADEIQRRFPWVVLVRNASNKGYTGGNNAGMRVATGEWFLLLNNDTIVEPGLLEPLLDAVRNEPDIGALSPKIRYFDDPNVIQYAGANDDVDMLLGRASWRGCGQADSGQFDEPTDTAIAHGAAFMVRRSVVEQVGTLWEDYFIYYEELDWSLRIRAAGWRIRYVPGSDVLHKESMSVGKHSPFKVYQQCRNRIWMVRRHGSLTERAVFFAWVVMASMPRNTLRHGMAGRLDLLKAQLSGTLAGLTAQQISGQTALAVSL